MEHNTNKIPRLEVVDALRGFALCAILLVHNVEHYIFSVYPETSSEWLTAMDGGVNSLVFALFGGKAYAIFSLLFGFTFYVQYENQRLQGRDFGYRFLWRLVGLVLLATIDAAFFPGGDILLLYAVVGVVLFVVRKWSNRAILIAAILFFLQPMELYHAVASLVDPSHQLPDYGVGAMYATLGEVCREGSVAEFLWCNIATGQLASFMWAVGAGRLSQTIGLFLLGLYLGRTQRFVGDEQNQKFWVKMLVVAALLYVPMASLHATVVTYTSLSAKSLATVLDMWQKLSFTFVLISSFVLVYRMAQVRRCITKLAIYGSMSLTNYVTQSIFGALIYFPLGLYLAPYCGHSVSLIIGCVLFVVQLRCSVWWSRRYGQGPLERLWHKWTWLGA